MGDMIWMSVAALLTLAIFTFLYKDNPIYKFAEHLLVGTSAGYYLVIYYYNSVKPNMIDEIVQNNNFIPIIPAIIGILVLFRLSRKYGWVSRYSIGFYMGTGIGLSLPVVIQASIFEQLRGTIVDSSSPQTPPVFNIQAFKMFFTDPTWGGFVFAISGPLVIIGVLCTLSYFFFSREHKGFLGVTSKIGIWFLMIGFGASFGYTVMARVSLLIGRVDFLINDWVKGLIAMFGG